MLVLYDGKSLQDKSISEVRWSVFQCQTVAIPVGKFYIDTERVSVQNKAHGDVHSAAAQPAQKSGALVPHPSAKHIPFGAGITSAAQPCSL